MIYYYRDIKNSDRVMGLGPCGCCAESVPDLFLEEYPDEVITASTPEELRKLVEEQYPEIIPWMSQFEVRSIHIELGDIK